MPEGKDSTVSSAPRTSPAEPSRSALVTIGMPVRNGARYLEEAIAAMQAQTEDDFILHISDNCSDDATPKICARLAAQDPRIRYERQARNLGAAGNFNYLLNSARTPFFTWAAHDDLRAPTFLATSLHLLRDAPDAVACSVGVGIIDETGAEIDRVLPPPGLASSRPSDRARAVNNRGHMAIYGLMRPEALPADARIGDYLGADIAFVFNIALNRRIVTTDEILLIYRSVDYEAKLRGTEGHLYDYTRSWKQMYVSMSHSADRSPLGSAEKAGLRFHVAWRRLVTARWAAANRNMGAIHRARAEGRYGAVLLRMPAQVLLGPGHVVAAIRRMFSAPTHR